MLGVQPLIGRILSGTETRDGAASVVLSYDLWRGQFGGDANVVGRSITLDGAPYVVVGVMPSTFGFPDRTARFWTPMNRREVDDTQHNNNWFMGVARLRAGATIARAQADLSRTASQMAREYPDELAQVGATVQSLRGQTSAQSRMLLLALCGASLCVLLIACANVASLLLARAVARRRELAVRTALGAGRERLLRQLVSESLVLACLGGALGVVIAIISVPLLTQLLPDSLALVQVPAIDFRVLAFATALTLATGVGFGVIPSLGMSRTANLGALRDGSRTGGGRTAGARAVLVIVEVAMSVVLLVSAGLLVQAMWRVQSVDPGFVASNVLTLRTELPRDRYPSSAERQIVYDKVLGQVRAIPGVQSAAYASFLPMIMGGGIWPVALPGASPDRATSERASLRFVTPGYMEALRIPLIHGRGITEADTRSSPMVAVVSESFAKHYWRAADPLGQRFDFGGSRRTVIGVVRDVRVRGLERTSEPQVYLPYRQFTDSAISSFYAPKDLVIRSSLAAGTLLPTVRSIVHAADPQLPIRTCARSTTSWHSRPHRVACRCASSRPLRRSPSCLPPWGFTVCWRSRYRSAARKSAFAWRSARGAAASCAWSRGKAAR